MKLVPLILLQLFIIGVENSHAQKPKGELIQMLNHDYKIDSLLTNVVGNDTSFATKYPCVVIHTEKNDSVTFLSINSYNYDDISRIKFVTHSRGEHLGFFKLNRYTVFVISSRQFSGLFSATGKTARIMFNIDDKVENSSSVLNVPYLADFMYQNGKFSPMYGAR